MHPRYATWQNATKCGLATRQMERIMWMSMRCSLGRASTCRGMLYYMKIWSEKCWSHQRFAAQHRMSKGFQNCISQFEKKIRWSSFVSFHSFCNLKYSLQKIIFKCGHDQIGGIICRATFAVRQSCNVLHSAMRHSVDAPWDFIVLYSWLDKTTSYSSRYGAGIKIWYQKNVELIYHKK